jgi:hypothetical protein
MRSASAQPAPSRTPSHSPSRVRSQKRSHTCSPCASAAHSAACSPPSMSRMRRCLSCMRESLPCVRTHRASPAIALGAALRPSSHPLQARKSRPKPLKFGSDSPSSRARGALQLDGHPSSRGTPCVVKRRREPCSVEASLEAWQMLPACRPSIPVGVGASRATVELTARRGGAARRLQGKAKAACGGRSWHRRAHEYARKWRRSPGRDVHGNGRHALADLAYA